MTAQPFRRVLVTGAAGFVGYHLSDRLLREGVEVLGVDDLNAYYDVGLKEDRLCRLRGREGFRFVRADIVETDRFLELARGYSPDVVVHLAAQAGVRSTDPWPYARSNLNGFLSVLECCRELRVGHLVYASSSSVYGANRSAPFREEDAVDHPVSFYAATKRSNELMAESYAKLHGLPCTGLRFFTLYGPWGRPDMAYYSFTRDISEGRAIRLFNGGDMLRDFTFVSDAIEAVVRLLGRPPGGPEMLDGATAHRIFNIGNASPVRLADFVGCLESEIGRKAVKELLPMQPGDVPVTYADTSRLRATVDYAPNTPIAVGLRYFVEWYRNYHCVADSGLSLPGEVSSPPAMMA